MRSQTRRNLRRSLSEERKAIRDYKRRGDSAERPAVKKAYGHAREEEKEHASAFQSLLRSKK